MPWTPAQRRLFAVKYRRGELSKAQFDKMMSEGVRRDVGKSGHAKKHAKKQKRKAHASTRRHARR